MRKYIILIFFTLFFTQNVNAKTIKWNFEVQSNETNLIKCIKVIEVKSKRSLMNSLSGMGIISKTPTIVKLQNNCKDGIKGFFEIKLLDKDGFMIDRWSNSFSVGRKGITTNTFEFLTPPLKWKKIKSALLEFSILETF